jgi:hypothetical protein
VIAAVAGDGDGGGGVNCGLGLVRQVGFSFSLPLCFLTLVSPPRPNGWDSGKGKREWREADAHEGSDAL